MEVEDGRGMRREKPLGWERRNEFKKKKNVLNFDVLSFCCWMCLKMRYWIYVYRRLSPLTRFAILNLG